VDEIHNISLATRAGAEVSDTLKYFAERLLVTFGYAGPDVARHSGATSIKIRLALSDDGGLSIEVSDDGTGPSSSWKAGFGLTSMRERAAELDGSFEAGPAPDGGGRVTASLPLGQSPAELTIP
jgi:signal transduction histidine kinase